MKPIPGCLLRPVFALAAGIALSCGGAGTTWAAGYVPPAKPLAIDDLAQYEALSGVTISPDGKHIAALIAVKGQDWPVISIWETADLHKTPIWIPSKTQRIDQVGFFTSDKIYFVTEQPITRYDGKPSFIRKIYYADLDGRNIQEPFRITGTLNKEARDDQERGISATIFNTSLYDDTKVLMESVDPDSGVQKIFELNTKTGDTRTVAVGSENFSYLAEGVDPSTGDPLIKAKVDPVNGEYWYKVYIKDKATGEWVYHAPLSYMLKDRKELNIMGFDSDPSKLIVASNLKSDHSALYEYDIKSQTMSAEPLYANDRYDFVDVAFHVDRAAKTTSIMAVVLGGPDYIVSFADEKWAAAQKSIQAAFPGRNVHLRINRDTYDSAVVEVEAPNFPPQYYLYQGGKLVSLGGARPNIDPATLGKPEFVTFKARDAWIFRPSSPTRRDGRPTKARCRWSFCRMAVPGRATRPNGTSPAGRNSWRRAA